ncbi:MAG TPA: hypothetical protein VM283_02200 [Armatimonadota bacterium]|nr:hypothetical protein [Armatimonadota bacterium]
MSRQRDGSIYDRLDQLAEYSTVPEFAHAFYELIADYALGSEGGAPDVGGLFLDYLAVEQRYHGCLSSLTSDDVVSLGDIRDAAEKREIGLRSVLEMLDSQRGSGLAEVARVLLSAECYFHLGLTDRVVERLETAVNRGAGHPLVQFALGYNRFQLANQAFTRFNAETGEHDVVDEDRYRLACLNAVRAFQEGLSGDGFDGQLHWWIGNVLRAAGFTDAAEASMRRAAEMLADPLQWEDGELAGEDLWGDESGDDEIFGPITVAEVEEASALLRRSYRLSDLA